MGRQFPVEGLEQSNQGFRQIEGLANLRVLEIFPVEDHRYFAEGPTGISLFSWSGRGFLAFVQFGLCTDKGG